MSDIMDRAIAAVDETVGKAKRAIGEVLHSPDIKKSGDRQEAKGDAEKAKTKTAMPARAMSKSRTPKAAASKKPKAATAVKTTKAAKR